MSLDNNDYIWRIRHIPTGLFYCKRKGSLDDNKTNLSEKGNHYTSEKIVTKVLDEDCIRALINKTQIKKHNLQDSQITKSTYSNCHTVNRDDFKIVKYQINEVIKDE